MQTVAAMLAFVPEGVPVDPDAPDAKTLLLDELGKPEYAAARPTLIDRIAQAIQDWLGTFRAPDGVGGFNIFPLVATLLIVGLIVAAFIVFGRPRLRLRSGVSQAIFENDDDSRSAADLRASAERAASAGDFVTGIEEMFRSIARQTAERTIIASAPGMTAQDFARRSGLALPSLLDRLRRGAELFDGVRYLDERGSREAFEHIASLERDARGTIPTRLDRVGHGAGPAGPDGAVPGVSS